VLAHLAKSLGLDMDKYDECMKSEKYRAKVQSHLMEAERRGVNQTPTFIIGGKAVPGAIPYDTFKKLVDEELAKAPAADTTRKSDTSKTAAAPAADSEKTTAAAR
jgi:predicted DsbA family dithiol-disulfide isomerase